MVGTPPGLSNKVEAAIELGALLNATRHGGRAEMGAVMGRILAEFPEFRSTPGNLQATVRKAVDRVNAMPPREQERLLSERYPEAATPSRSEGRVGLPPLPNAVKGKASFRLPPEPSGFMHIGHAMAFTINYLYKESYDGQLWLRFEDTNPKKVFLRYYESFREGIRWLGITWEHEKNVSDDIEKMYQYGETLINQGKAYACSCEAAKVKQLRFDGKACEHAAQSVEKNLSIWKELLAGKHREGDYVVRFRGDMGSANYSLRDPNIFRVIDHKHPLTGDKYSLWPTYDVANAIEDEMCGITHVLRSSEFRNELQQLIRDALGFRHLEVIQFSRFRFKGTPVQKRLLRPLVEERLVSGWDDPRMPTLKGLERRGVVPQTIRDFTLLVGYTKTEHEYDWSMLLSINRKVLDPTSRRLFFVPDPAPLTVEGAPRSEVTIPFHPQKDLGQRLLRVGRTLFIPRADLATLEPGSEFRLMDLFNVKLKEGPPNAVAKYVGEELAPETKKLQWTGDDFMEAKVLIPGPLFLESGEFNAQSMVEIRGVVEKTLSSFSPGEIFQFPRFGFCRLDSPGVLIMTG